MTDRHIDEISGIVRIKKGSDALKVLDAVSKSLTIKVLELLESHMNRDMIKSSNLPKDILNMIQNDIAGLVKKAFPEKHLDN